MKLFDSDEPEFDQNTYLGRFEEFRSVADPFKAFFTNGRIREMQAMLERIRQEEQQNFEKTGSRKMERSDQEIKQIRTAQTVVSTAIHPDTKEMLPWVLRFSSFLPMNIPIGFGFIIAAPTPFNTIFWQWINQTYNAALNYANRNASSTYTNQDIIKSYLAATGSSITISLVIRKILEKRTAGVTGAKGYVYNTISSFFACASAGFLNAWFMR
jgi:uncharacterized membrane protein (DUF106 family)